MPRLLGICLLALVAVTAGGCTSKPGRYVVDLTSSDTFDPAHLRVPVGSTVVWTNTAPAQPAGFVCPVPDQPKSPLCHDVDIWQSDTHVASSFNASRKTALLAPGQSFEWTFTSAGDFQVFCHTHHDPERMLSDVRVG